MNNITLYSTGCPRCRVLHQKLREKGVSFTVVDDIDVMLDMGMMEAPVLEADGRQMGFVEAVDWINHL